MLNSHRKSTTKALGAIYLPSHYHNPFPFAGLQNRTASIAPHICPRSQVAKTPDCNSGTAGSSPAVGFKRITANAYSNYI